MSDYMNCICHAEFVQRQRASAQRCYCYTLPNSCSVLEKILENVYQLAG